MKIRKLVVLTALSMALLSGAAMADGHGDKSKHDKMQHKGDRSEMMVERMTERLGLSDQQAVDIKSLMERHHNGSKEIREAQRSQFEAEMGAILTPEQKAMFDENKEMRKDKMKPRRGKGERHKESHEH